MVRKERKEVDRGKNEMRLITSSLLSETEEEDKLDLRGYGVSAVERNREAREQ